MTNEADQPPDRPHRPRKRDDDDFLLFVPRPRPFIKPSVYDARSDSVKPRRFWDREYLQVDFTIFEGAATDGVILATGVSAYYPLSGGAASNLVRLIQLLDPNAKPGEVRASAIKGKLFRVEVETVTTDRYNKPLPEPNYYSKVARVTERI
jgi:hypothetical protein